MAINKEALVQKSKYGLRRAIFSRTGLVALLFLLQAGLLISVMVWFQEWQAHVVGASAVLTMAAVLVVLNSDLDPTAKLTWMVVMTFVPVFGALFYWYTRRDVGHRVLKAVMTERQTQSRHQLSQDPAVWKALSARAPGAAGMARYVRRSGCFPVFGGTEVTYFPMGEDYCEGLLRELENAEKFIFMEYFILDEGYFWDSILDVLKRKAASGVDVRVMYDGTCEFVLLPRHYPKELEKFGIQCQVFAPLEPFVSTHYNYRDHRKITVIDGKVAFTGGVNLADEYINRCEKYGHWKDTGLMLRGPAAESFTVMFLQLWSADLRSPEYHKFLRTAPEQLEAPGFVMPYSDSPLVKLLGCTGSERNCPEDKNTFFEGLYEVSFLEPAGPVGLSRHTPLGGPRPCPLTLALQLLGVTFKAVSSEVAVRKCLCFSLLRCSPVAQGGARPSGPSPYSWWQFCGRGST